MRRLRRLWAWCFKKPELEFVSATVSGIGGRSNMEDANGVCRVSESACCWVVADGVGGYKAGEVAAHMAVDCLSNGFRQFVEYSGENLRGLIEHAHQDIQAAQFALPESRQMATTVVVLILSGAESLWGHVGDSRLYRFRRGRIDRRTKDHSLAQLLVDRGQLASEDLRHFPQRNVILQALGQTDGKPEVAIAGPERLKVGDTFLLCTDGFWEPLAESEMELELARSSSVEDWLRRLEARLAAIVEKRASGWQHHDNYTAVAIRVKRRSAG